MNPPMKSSETARQELQALTAELHKARETHSAPALAPSLTRLARALEESEPAAAALAQLGALLARAATAGEGLADDDLRRTVRDLAKALAMPHEEAAPAPAVALPVRVQLNAPSAAQANLTMRDGRRLGELLQQLSMLDAAQVEEAIRVQRATGKRLGEALVDLQMLTPAMLESALRLQKTKRTSASRGAR